MKILHDCLLFSLNRIKSMTHESPKSKFNIYFNLMSMSKSKLMVNGFGAKVQDASYWMFKEADWNYPVVTHHVSMYPIHSIHGLCIIQYTCYRMAMNDCMKISPSTQDEKQLHYQYWQWCFLYTESKYISYSCTENSNTQLCALKLASMGFSTQKTK